MSVSLKQRVKEAIFPVINKLINPLSLSLRGKGDPNRTFYEFIDHLDRLNMKPRTVIDVGVAFGTPNLYRATIGAQLYLVEPVPACAPILEKFKSQLGAYIFNVAAGSEDGEIEFNVHRDVSGSSALKQVEGKELDGTTYKVPVRRLDSIIPSDIKGPVLLKIDTQGYEIEVIRGATETLKRVDVAILECSFNQYRIGAPEIGEVIVGMAECGFLPYETLEGHYRPLDNALGQIDVAFVKKDSPLRENPSAFSEAQLRKYLRRN